MYFPVRYLILFLSALSITVDYVTRTNLNVAIVSMVKSGNVTTDRLDVCHVPVPMNSSSEPNSNSSAPRYDWSPQVQGLILGAFFYPYVLMQVPSGKMAERFGGKWVICLGLLGSGVLNLMTPLIASSFALIILSRLALGLFQGGIYASAYGLVHGWLPKRERSFGFGMLNVGSALGSVIATSLTGYLSDYGFAGGWPSAFYVAGLLGLGHFVICAILLTSKPDQHYFVSDREMELIEDREHEPEASSVKPTMPWAAILSSSKFWAVSYTQFAQSFGYIMAATKVPTYLFQILHIDPTEDGILSSLLYIACIVAMPFVGPLSEWMVVKKWTSRTNVRKGFVITSYGITATCFAMIPFFNCDKYAVMFFLVLAHFAIGIDCGGTVPVIGEMTMHFPSSVFAMSNTVVMSSGYVGPYVAGLFLQNGGDVLQEWNMLFYLTSLISLSGLLVFVCFAEAERQPWDIVDSDQEELISPTGGKSDMNGNQDDAMHNGAVPI
ncbi:putative inorganic phosphate cotransporter [Halotydeus destructor]|nr:putative inorganic phosphate cotransporter [Halotydeus destructor]